MKIIFYEVEDWQREPLQHAFSDHELVLLTEALNQDNWQTAEGAEIISVFIDSIITSNLLRNLSSLKLIATRSTGYDHIDTDNAKQKNITIANVPSYGNNTVAEHTFALILTISRKIFQTVERTERGNFDLDGLQGFDLKGKTIGIFGLGKIGQHVARIAQGFEMNILACKRTPDPLLAQKFGLQFVAEIDELMQKSDILTLHSPLTPETQHLINSQNIKNFKPGAILINTARGGLVETAALLTALQQGNLSGAGLDVLEEEKPLKEEAHLLSPAYREQADLATVVANHVLIARDDVIFTAHNAFNSKEAVNRILNTTIDNIKAFLDGHPQSVVQ